MSRLHTFSRFAEPTAEDDHAECQGCGQTFHYEELDDEGLCPACCPEPDAEPNERKHD
jgi:hypothetical protein